MQFKINHIEHDSTSNDPVISKMKKKQFHSLGFLFQPLFLNNETYLQVISPHRPFQEEKSIQSHYRWRIFLTSNDLVTLKMKIF